LSDDVHRAAMLRHRPLTEHLAGDHELRPFLLHDALCMLEHEDSAIDARVHRTSITVARVLDHPQVFYGQIERAQFNPERSRRLGNLRGASLVGIDEVLHGEADDFDPRMLDNRRREGAIKASR